MSLRVIFGADLFVSDPLSRVRHVPKCVRTLKIQYPSVVKSVGISAGGVETRTRCTQGESWVAPCYGCSLSPGKAARISRALHWD